MKPILILICSLIFTLATQVSAAEKNLSVGILLYPGVEIIDFTGPYEIFGWAEYEVSTVSQDGNPIVTTMNLTITPTYSFAKAPSFDILVIPGGDYEKAIDKPTLDWVRIHSQSATRVVSVCNGAFILAEAGLLNGLTATTFYPALEALKEKYPKIKTVSNKRFVDNGKFITSAGLSSGIDAALHLVSQHQGMEKAQSIAAAIEYGWSPDKGYIRGNMADKHLQSIRKNLSEIIADEPAYSYGTESEWFESYNLKSSALNTDAKSVKKILSSAMAETQEWLPNKDARLKDAWIKKSEGNTTWILAINYSQTAQKPIEIKIHLYQKP